MNGLAILHELWVDDAGALISLEMVLLATILGIGLIAAMSALQTAIVTEMADVGGAISSLNQSYEFGGISGHTASTAGSSFLDQPDSGDDVGGTQPPGANSRGIIVCAFVFHEGQPLPLP